MKVIVVSNMYPNEKNPAYGIFVKKFCDQLETLPVTIDKCIMHRSDLKIQKVLHYIWFYMRTFLKLLFSKYDLVYVHYPSFSGAVVLFVSKFKKIRIYTNLHGSDVVPEKSRHEKMQKYTVGLLKRSEKVIVPSEYFKKYVQVKYKIADDVIFIYPSGGIDSNIFYPTEECEKRETREYYGLSCKSVVFGMAGRICTGKGFDIFVEAVKEALERGIDAQYIIIGSGIEEDKLEEKIHNACLDEKIIWIHELISQKELARFYNCIDYLVFPTMRKGESLGLVAVEAMACGTPVLASNYAAPRYYISNGYNGWKFKVGSANDLCEAMIRGIEWHNNGKIEALKRGALDKAGEYMVENVIGSLYKIFDNLTLEN